MEKPLHYSRIKTGRLSLSSWLDKNYPEFYNYLLNNYQGIDIKTAIYMYYNNLSSVPLCECGRPVKFHGYSYGFSKFCCSSCASRNGEVQAKLKESLKNEYGENYRSFIAQKSQATKLSKYGDPFYNNPSKSKQSCLERYGVDNPMKLDKFKTKSKQSCLERYGSEYYLNSQQHKNIKNDCIKKTKETCIKKYGYSNQMLSQDIKNKVRETCLERYGVEWSCMRPEAKISHNSNSKPNTNFAKLLDDNNIQYQKEFYLNGKSYDFKVGDTLIEVNPSVTHNINWNPYGGKIMDKNYHLEKTELAKKNNYNIINIWDWDDINKIIYLLKPKNKIYARNCKIQEIDQKACNEFLNTYHFQNTCKGQSIRIGLYYGDILVGLLTFGKPRYNKNYEYELLRLCYHKDYKVIGGTEKMFKYFLNTYNPRNIISYCDNSKFNGSVYKKLGFNMINSSPSKHWYNSKTSTHITNNLLIQRGFDQLFGTEYGKGFNNQELMRSHGFVEVYDAGQVSYIWQK